MKQLWVSVLCLVSVCVRADTVERYMNIVSSIPNMEMKADSQSQAWARSARSIMHLTNESIAETLMFSNTAASQHGPGLFCLPKGLQLNARLIGKLIKDQSKQLASSSRDYEKMSVSEVALLAVTQAYPCAGAIANAQGISGLVSMANRIHHVAAND